MYSPGSSSYVCRTSPKQLLNNSLYRFFILPSQKTGAPPGAPVFPLSYILDLNT